jgi:hypothetical protein
VALAVLLCVAVKVLLGHDTRAECQRVKRGQYKAYMISVLLPTQALLPPRAEDVHSGSRTHTRTAALQQLLSHCPQPTALAPHLLSVIPIL